MAEDNMDVAISNSHSEVRWDNLSHQSTRNTHQTYKCLCLSNPERKARPSKAVKEKLKEMGLGRQDIQISSTASATDVKAKFEEAYPKLEASCGFHILIQDTSNPSELVLVECNLSAGYNGQFLHDNFKGSICYIRPRTSLSNSSSEAFVNPREEQESNYIDPAQQSCSNLATRPTAADLTGEYQETALPSHADHPNSGTDESSVTGSGNGLAEELNDEWFESTEMRLNPTNAVNNEDALLPTSFEEDGDQNGFSEGVELKKECIKCKISDDGLWRALTREYSFRKKHNRKCENGETSSDTVLGLSDDHSFKVRFNELALHDESEAVSQKDPLEIKITPSASSVEVQSTFNINANQGLPEGLYFVKFGEYGMRNASGDGHKCLQGKENIPKATRKETHDVTVMVYDVHLKEIGHCLFTYIGTNGNANKQKVPSEDQSSIDRSVTPNRSLNRRKSSSQLLVTSSPLGPVD